MHTIRSFREHDWPGLWDLLRPVFAAGDTYPYSPTISEDEARREWIDTKRAAYVAVDSSERVLGSYYIKDNQPTLGAHVCNCGYVVSETARGQGLGTRMCEHSQAEARRLGYRCMQYNLVVATNTVAIKTWENQGFAITGTLPGAFRHPTLGYVDALIMYKQLET